MSLNTAHAENGVLIHAGEFILIFCDAVNVEFGGQDGHEFRGTKSGRMYLTTHRMIFNSKNNSDQMRSFSFPFVALSDVGVEQPMFGANYIKGKVRAQPNGNWIGEAKFKLTFKSGGAIEYGQAMLKAAHMATRGMRADDAPPPYMPPTDPWYAAPPPAYAPPPQGYYGWVPPTQAFPDQPPPNSVYMSPNPPPYPGINVGPYPNQPGGSPQGYPNQPGPPQGYPGPPQYQQQSYGPPPGNYPSPQGGGYPNAPAGGYPNAPAGGYPNAPAGGYPNPQGAYPQAGFAGGPSYNGQPGYPTAPGFSGGPGQPFSGPSAPPGASAPGFNDAKAAEAAQSAYYDPNKPQMAYVPPPAYYEQPPSYQQSMNKKED